MIIASNKSYKFCYECRSIKVAKLKFLLCKAKNSNRSCNAEKGCELKENKPKKVTCNIASV